MKMEKEEKKNKKNERMKVGRRKEKQKNNE